MDVKLRRRPQWATIEWALVEVRQKADDNNFLCGLAETVPQVLMEADVEGLNGAGHYERPSERSTYRHAYRERTLDTRMGSPNLKILKLSTGSYSPGFLEPRKTLEKALVAVIQEAWIAGVSTRRANNLVQARGLPVSQSSRSRSSAKVIDEQVNIFLTRALGCEALIWLDTSYSLPLAREKYTIKPGIKNLKQLSKHI